VAFDHPSHWICPDLTPYWQLGQLRNSNQVILQALEGNQAFYFSEIEGYALRYFTGQFTVAQVQQFCQQQFNAALADHFVMELLQTLVNRKLLIRDEPVVSAPRFKASVHWIAHPDGYWILRNSEDVTFLQVSDRDKAILDVWEHGSPQAITQQFNITPEALQYLVRLLVVTGMLEGTTPPKPQPRKFHPMQLMFFKRRLCNPDRWLTRHVHALGWIWTKRSFFILLILLTFSGLIGLHQQAVIGLTAQQLLQHRQPAVALTFLLLTAIVVTLHELGHAFTLKHYQGIVPEMGLMFMLLMPVAYTNTTDQYSLPKRRQRALVVGAGVLCQLTIGAIAFWIWNSAASGSWLWMTSYLLMVAALITVALNLNPLARFDGYYLAVALTGINNLRRRSFQFYKHLFSLQPSPEQGRDRWVLAAYAPLSFLYITGVFGFLVLRLGDWIISHIPITALGLLTVWAVYFFTPSATTQESRD
jgi:putative peptide zinc metalloprotease protein